MSQRNVLKENLAESARVLRERIGDRRPEVGMILGSGLGPLAGQIEDAVCVPYGEVPHMRTSTATSHVGRFVCGVLGGKCVLAMQGRLHGYEGNTAQEVAYPVWLMHELGVGTLFATNAAGAINEGYRVGDFCLIEDHINFTGRNPVAGLEPDGIAFRFFSMLDAYDPALRRLARETADELGIRVQEGVYLGLLGPSFETPAEIRAFRTWGADTVAMSVCEEVIAARHVGMRVLGMSLVSNMACGIEGASPTDEEVLDVARRPRGRLRAPGHRHRGADVARRVGALVLQLEVAVGDEAGAAHEGGHRPADNGGQHQAYQHEARPLEGPGRRRARPPCPPPSRCTRRWAPRARTCPCPRPRRGRSAAGRTRRWQAAP